MTNIDPHEVARFDELAERWWDSDGELRPLHDINAGRIDYVAHRVPLAGRRVLDVGCGGGIASEALARRGARVTGIDASPAAVAAARRHAEAGGLAIDYRETTAEALVETEVGGFDLVLCLELLEHVPDAQGLVGACVRLARPGGDLVFATINRTPKAYALAVLGAEYLLRLLPRGTHDYARFVRPSELARWLRAAGCSVLDVSGLAYNPFTRRSRVRRDVAVNYMVHARRDAR